METTVQRMKTLLCGGLLAMLVPYATFSQEPSKRATYETAKLQVTQCALKVSGMVCGGCAEMVKQGLLKVEGVKAAKVDYKSGGVQVSYDPKKTTPAKIAAAFNQASQGFRAELLKPQAK
jgi:copper chaperone CopZ